MFQWNGSIEGAKRARYRGRVSSPPLSPTRAQVARSVAAGVGLAAIYAAVARLGLLMDAVSGFATLVWPATGIALVALLRLGLDLWPGIFVGALVVNVWTGAPLLVACGIAAGNTLEALAGAWAVRRVTGMREMPTRLSEAVGLVALAALGSTVVSATLGTLSLRLGGVIGAAAFADTWRAWWLGDVTGDLVVAPLLLAFSVDGRGLVRVPARRAVEAFALAVAVVAGALLIFETDLAGDHAFAQPYMLFPLLAWASLRFGLRGASAATFAVSVVAIASTSRGHGPFVHARLATSLFFLQAFMAVVSVTTLLLAVAIDERDRAVKAREWLLAAVSHDLKNPLNMIGLGTDFLARFLPEEGPPRRQLGNLRAAIKRMNALVRDLLDLSALEAGGLSIERAAVRARVLVDEALEATRPLAEARSQSLHATIATSDPIVVCDAGRVVQVLVNLADNAIKFSPEGSPINVTVDGDAETVRFAVTDTGAGLSVDDARRVFEPFWRARGAATARASGSPSRAPSSRRTAGASRWRRARAAAAPSGSRCRRVSAGDQSRASRRMSSVFMRSLTRRHEAAAQPSAIAVTPSETGFSSAMPKWPIAIPAAQSPPSASASTRLGAEAKNERRSRIDEDREDREEEQHLEAERLEPPGASAMPSRNQANASRPSASTSMSTPSTTPTRTSGRDVPALGPRRAAHAIGRQRDLDEVGHEHEHQHGQRRDDEAPGHQEGDDDEPRLEDGAAHLVDDPGEHALEDRAAVLHEVDDARQALAREHDAGGALGHVGGAADGDADLGLAQRGRVVDAVAGHADDVPGGLEALDDAVLVLGEDLGEAVVRLRQLGGARSRRQRRRRAARARATTSPRPSSRATRGPRAARRR